MLFVIFEKNPVFFSKWKYDCPIIFFLAFHWGQKIQFDGFAHFFQTYLGKVSPPFNRGIRCKAVWKNLLSGNLQWNF